MTLARFIAIFETKSTFCKSLFIGKHIKITTNERTAVLIGQKKL